MSYHHSSHYKGDEGHFETDPLAQKQTKSRATTTKAFLNGILTLASLCFPREVGI